METLLYTDEAFLGHQPGVGHPERPERLASVVEALDSPRFDSLRRVAPREATAEEIERVHEPAYVETLLRQVPSFGAVHVDADTVLSPGSGTAALRAAGATLLNKAVLLAGVNDDAEALASLSDALFEAGVLPYYLHQLDRVAGVMHFEVPESHGRRLIAELERRLPGYAVPRYVREVPGAAGKVRL